MKSALVFFVSLTAVSLVGISVAFAGEDVACAIGCGTSTANSTHATCTVTDGGSETFECSPDAGGTCNWNHGDTVLAACDQDVYFHTADGGSATSLDFDWQFSANGDPVPIYLLKDEKGISCLAVSAHAKCKFGKTYRPKPWKNNP